MFFAVLLCSCVGTRNTRQLANIPERRPVKCLENSPERHGEEGCSILSNRPLAGPFSTPLYWHIDRFESLEAAQKFVGVNSVADSAHGGIWLMSVESDTNNHHGGTHVTSIGPLTLPVAENISMRVQSSYLLPGTVTPVHTHSGPETFYIVDGMQCIERVDGAVTLAKNASYTLPGNTIHRGRVIGTSPRRALGLVLYDAKYPSSHDLENPPVLRACR
jgi:quercetin dioxygenase-like cupin family protein